MTFNNFFKNHWKYNTFFSQLKMMFFVPFRRNVESTKSQLYNRDIVVEMESSHSLILNEDAFKQIPDHKKPVYVFEWLRYLDKGLVAAQKVRFSVNEIFSFLIETIAKQTNKLNFHCFKSTVGCESMPKKVS